jgi:hypothetical protein
LKQVYTMMHGQKNIKLCLCSVAKLSVPVYSFPPILYQHPV